MPEPVLALLTQPEPGGLSKVNLEALGAAGTLASLLGSDLVCAVIGDDVAAAAAEAGERGALRVLTVDDERLARASGDLAVAAAAATVEAAAAGHVVFGRGADVLELVPRLAARLDGACLMGVTEFRRQDDELLYVATVFGGAARAVFRLGGPGPHIISPAPAMAPAPEREAGRSVEPEALAVPDVTERVTLETPSATAEGPRLEDANVVVSGGRGLRESDNYQLVRDLAEALGGMAGASRAIVDDGWVTAVQQVGLTGKIVTPDLYVAAGISGASQHMAGCANARVIVAINTDPQAPIFKYAHYGIVDDCLEVLPELIRLAREAR
ncbi:MAG: electron transfer flavoprotein subunit alpha/FixB family protein [Dehalococcoidia bacterium]